MAAFDYNRIEAGYYDKVFQRNSGAQAKWHHLKFSHLRYRLGCFDRHLDIGCGPGTFIGTLSEGLSVGIDISPVQIDYARKHYGNKRAQFEVVEGIFPFDNNTFDVATCVEVVEHLEIETSQCLFSEAFRVLKPGGKLYVTTPNYASLWPILEWCVNHVASVTYEEQHITKFKPENLHRLLTECPFSTVTVRGFQGLEFAAAAIGWELPEKLLPLSRSLLEPFSRLLLLGEATK